MPAADIDRKLQERIAVWSKHQISAGGIPGLVDRVGAVRAIQTYTHARETPGFDKVCDRLGPEYTLEALVVEHPECFDASTIQAAENRLGAMDADQSVRFDEDPEDATPRRDPFGVLDPDDERRSDFLEPEPETDGLPTYRESWDE